MRSLTRGTHRIPKSKTRQPITASITEEKFLGAASDAEAADYRAFVARFPEFRLRTRKGVL